jgi:GTP-binding protein EngB required for normal cell division
MQVRRFLDQRPTLRLAVLLLDSRRDPQRSDLNMIRFFRNTGLPLLVVATKVS